MLNPSHPGNCRNWRYRLLLLTVSCSFFIQSFACKCEEVNTVERNYTSSSIVFTGKVIKTEYVGLSETMITDSLDIARKLASQGSKNALDVPMVLKAIMVVTSEFKGTIKNDTVVVYTGIRGATCGFKFEVNKEYTVYAATECYMYMFLPVNRQRFKKFNKSGTYWTNLCTRTTIAVGQEHALLNDYLKKK